MSLFGANWRNLVTNLLPDNKRTVSMIDFITSLVDPVETSSTALSTFETSVRKSARFNGKHLVLSSALNNLFAVSGIRVETERNPELIYNIYNEAEGFPVLHIYNQGENQNVYFYNDAEVTNVVDFKVLIPVGIYTAELDRQVSAEVNKYKLFGKTFTIETY